MSDDELKAIRERCGAATPAPWYDDGYRVYGPTRSDDKRDGRCIFEYKHEPNFHGPDAAFIAHAREDVPALLDEVERLRAMVATHRKWALDYYGTLNAPLSRNVA